MPQVLPSCLQRWSAQCRWGGLRTSCCRSRLLVHCAAGLPNSSASSVGSGHECSSKRNQDIGWAQGIAESQRKQIRRLNRISDRLQNQLLDLDLDDSTGDEGDAARIRSNSAASSSHSDILRRSRRSRIRTKGRFRSRTAQGTFASPRVPPSPEVLVALLRRAEAKRSLLRELNVRSPKAVGSRLLLLSSLLNLSAEHLVDMSRKCGRLLLRRPDQLQAALAALADCMQPLLRQQQQQQQQRPAAGPDGRTGSEDRAARSGSSSSSGGGGSASAGDVRAEAEALARQMVVATPELLLVPPERLRRTGLELGAVCKARGIKLLPMLTSRPDLLFQSAASLAAKMDLLPGLLGLPPKRSRELLAARPDLLRRSPRQLSRRYQLLGELCGLPPDFLAELIAQEPGVLGFGADTLRAKFEALAGQYGRFQDDVADMILVDPAVLINAPPAPAAAAAAGGGASGGSQGGGGDVLPVLDQLLQLSSASGIPMDAVLRLVVQDETVCRYSRAQVAVHLAALEAALGLEGREVRARLSDQPGLLLLPPEQLAGRVEALKRLLQPPPDGGAGGGGAQEAAAGLLPTAAAPAAEASGLLRSQPELLLQDPLELYSRLAQLSCMLLGTDTGTGTGTDSSTATTTIAGTVPDAEPQSTPPPAAAAGSTLPLPPPPPPPLPPRLLALVAVHPALLTAPPEETADKLLVMQSLFEIPRALVLELVLREPALLAVSADDLERKFRALAASFGAFSSDAIDVVLADPSLILTADSDSEDSGSDSEAEGRHSSAPRAPQGGRQERQQQRSRQARAADQGAGAGASGRRAGPPGSGIRTGTGSRSGSPVAGAAARSGRSRQQQRGGGGGSGGGGAAVAAGRDQLGGGGGQRRRTDGRLESGSGSGLRQGAAQRPAPEQSADAERWLGSGFGAGGEQQKRQRQAVSGFGGAGGGQDAGGGGGGGGGGGKGADMGVLGAMSAADFDKLGSEDLPPPPPPSARRRRRLPQEQ
ncbi:hypothetical protein PLESTF_001253200 [Pleodorina starrii]|nr:hypothetical protein PLESTM_000396600 [Pleodorina starrii]GLC72490.1 hypothetical protein PLESTF_001253200 [Pleodorina starrii]